MQNTHEPQADNVLSDTCQHVMHLQIILAAQQPAPAHTRVASVTNVVLVNFVECSAECAANYITLLYLDGYLLQNYCSPRQALSV